MTNKELLDEFEESIETLTLDGERGYNHRAWPAMKLEQERLRMRVLWHMDNNQETDTLTLKRNGASGADTLVENADVHSVNPTKE